MKNVFLPTLLLLIILQQIVANLVSNSNFSSHPTIGSYCTLICPTSYYYEMFHYPYTGLQGWYQPTKKDIEFRTNYTNSAIIVVDMCSLQPYTLCQNITIPSLGAIYNFQVKYSASQDLTCIFLILQIGGSTYNTSHTCSSSVSKFSKNLTISQPTISICIRSSLQNTSCMFGPKIYNVALNVVCTILNCVSCDVNGLCLTCSTNYFLLNDSTCAACNVVISNCQNCITQMICGACITSYILIDNTSCLLNATTTSNTTNTTSTNTTTNTTTATNTTTTTNTTNTTNTTTSNTTTTSSTNNTATNNSSFGGIKLEIVIEFSTDIYSQNDFKPTWILKTDLFTPSIDNTFPNFNIIAQIIDIYIDGQKQQQVSCFLDKQSNLGVKIISTRYYTQKANIQIVFPDNIYFENVHFLLKTNNCVTPIQITFNERQIKVLQTYDQVSNYISMILQAFFSYMKSFGLGYFIFNLFSFWNLILLYHFLMIGTLPTFVKFLSQSIFRNTLISGILQTLHIDEFFVNLSPNNLVEKIPVSQTSWYWFLEFDFTSNFYLNNHETFIILLTLCLRLLIFNIIYKITGFKIFRIERKMWIDQIQVQFISYLPFLIVPSVLSLRESFFINKFDKINQIFQIMVLFICLIIPLIRLMTQIGFTDRQKISKSKKKQQKGILKVNFLYHCLNFTIPFFVAFQQKLAFFIINSILVIGQFVQLIYYRKSYNKFQFMVNFIMKTMFLVYHCIYLTFYIVDQLKIFSILENTLVLKLMGLIIIFILLIGGVIQFIVFIIEIIIEIVTFIITKIKFLKKQFTQITPDQQKEQKEQKASESNKQQKQSNEISQQKKEESVSQSSNSDQISSFNKSQFKVQIKSKKNNIRPANNIFVHNLFQPNTGDRKIKPIRFKLKNQKFN